MKLLRPINPSLAYVYCSFTVANYCLIMVYLGSLDSSHNLQANYKISFLFRLDLILHTCVAHIRYNSFEILNFASKPDLPKLEKDGSNQSSKQRSPDPASMGNSSEEP